MRWFLFFVTALVCAAAELQVPADVYLDRDVDYTSIPHGKLAMDVVRPKAPGKYPGIVMIHGGGFNGGTRDSYLPMAIRLAQNGYVAAAVSYRLAPMFQFPLPLYDVKARCASCAPMPASTASTRSTWAASACRPAGRGLSFSP